MTKKKEPAKTKADDDVRQPSVDKENETASVSTFRVEVVKDAMMKTSVRVYEHEIAILEEIHGADNIVVDEGSEKTAEIVDDAGAEYERLQTRFGRKGQAAVDKVYPNAASLAAASGLSFAGGRARAGRRNVSAESQQSSQRGGGAD